MTNTAARVPTCPQIRRANQLEMVHCGSGLRKKWLAPKGEARHTALVAPRQTLVKSTTLPQSIYGAFRLSAMPVGPCCHATNLSDDIKGFPLERLIIHLQYGTKKGRYCPPFLASPAYGTIPVGNDLTGNFLYPRVSALLSISHIWEKATQHRGGVLGEGRGSSVGFLMKRKEKKKRKQKMYRKI